MSNPTLVQPATIVMTTPMIDLDTVEEKVKIATHPSDTHLASHLSFPYDELLKQLMDGDLSVKPLLVDYYTGRIQAQQERLRVGMSKPNYKGEVKPYTPAQRSREQVILSMYQHLRNCIISMERLHECERHNVTKAEYYKPFSLRDVLDLMNTKGAGSMQYLRLPNYAIVVPTPEGFLLQFGDGHTSEMTGEKLSEWLARGKDQKLPYGGTGVMPTTSDYPNFNGVSVVKKVNREGREMEIRISMEYSTYSALVSSVAYVLYKKSDHFYETWAEVTCACFGEPGHIPANMYELNYLWKTKVIVGKPVGKQRDALFINNPNPKKGEKRGWLWEYNLERDFVSLEAFTAREVVLAEMRADQAALRAVEAAKAEAASKASGEETPLVPDNLPDEADDLP